MRVEGFARAPTSSFVDFEPVLPEMQALIVDYLANHTDVTFVDLEEDIPGFSGELTLRDTRSSNTILWIGLSPAAIHAMHRLQAEGMLEFRQVAPRLYASRGQRLQLPVKQTSPTERHWLPALIALKTLPI